MYENNRSYYDTLGCIIQLLVYVCKMCTYTYYVLFTCVMSAFLFLSNDSDNFLFLYSFKCLYATCNIFMVDF